MESVNSYFMEDVTAYFNRSVPNGSESTTQPHIFNEEAYGTVSKAINEVLDTFNKYREAVAKALDLEQSMLDNHESYAISKNEADKHRIRIDDDINHPSHYTHGKIESIDLMIECEGKEAAAHFCICNVWKYLYRHNHKSNDISDMRKLVWYANKYIELVGGNVG